MRRFGFAMLLVLVLAGSALATPQLVPLPGPPSKGRIDMVYEPGLEPTAKELRASAEDTLDRIADDLVDLPIPRHIRIQLVNEASDLAAIAPAGRGAPAYAIGVAYPDLDLISIAIRRGAELSDPGQTLRHELAHIALGDALGARAPHWLHEGFASQHSQEWSWDRMETLAGMAWMGGIIPFEQLDASFPADENPANRAYAQSYDFVGYLSRRGRWEDTDDDGDRWPFRRFLSAIGHGSDVDSAAMGAFGKHIKELFEEWREDLSKRYLLAPIGLFGLAIWVVCALLLAVGWIRKRRNNRRRLGEWDREESDARDRAAELLRRPPVFVAPPAYVEWPGEDPFADERPDPATPPDPKLVN